jgi:hypothetical protein
MLDPVKNLMRRHCLKKNASDVPTGITPLRDIHSAVAFIDVEDTSFHDCKNRILQFYREHQMKGEIFFFDFRKLGEGERLITSITTTILKKDLNWFDKPDNEKVAIMLSGEPDLFISMIPGDSFPLEFMAKCCKARFKIGRKQLPGDTFDMIFTDNPDKPSSQDEVFRKMEQILLKIQ